MDTEAINAAIDQLKAEGRKLTDQYVQNGRIFVVIDGVAVWHERITDLASGRVTLSDLESGDPYLLTLEN